MFGITCGDCGQTAEMDLWEKSAQGGKLPDNHFRCPGCGVRIRKESEPAEVVYVEGHPLIIPGDATILYC